ncbi:WbuC family cupin fold metalloprotein [bacterium]|nr:WbuC family cupin fold metalloprotein [bacterium]
MEKAKSQPINQSLLSSVVLKAKASPRKRVNHNFHQYQDPVQRFLNGIEPDSYIQPHRHIDPPKDEIFLVLKGRGAVVIFDDFGNLTEIHPLDISKGYWGIDIPGGVYHTIVSMEKESIFYEVKQGPYDPDTAKSFAPWSPEENSQNAVEYLENLKSKIKEYYTQL